MKITFDEILRDYLALRGESPDLLPDLEEGEDSAVLTIEKELRAKLLPCAIEASKALPRGKHDEIRSIQVSPEPDNGAFTIRLPDDYMMLQSLRMADWKEEVTSTEPEGTLRHALGANAPEWMICSENPMVKEGRDATGMFLRVYGSQSDSRCQLHYIPAPSFEGDTLVVSRLAYYEMMELLT